MKTEPVRGIGRIGERKDQWFMGRREKKEYVKKQIIWRDKREIVERKNNWFETGETYVRKKD